MYNHADLKNLTLEDLDDDKMYVVGVLRKILADKGLPSSMYAIYTWEKKHLIPKLISNSNGWRMYYGHEIRKFVASLSERSNG